MTTIQTAPVKKNKSLLRSTATVSTMTMLSRVMGFVRDVIIARIFGASAGMDAFLVAFKIPNFMRRLFAEGAFSQAFVPILSEYQRTQSFNQTQLFVSKIFGTLGFILFLLTIVVVIATPVMIMVFAPGFDIEGERYALAVFMLRITFPYLLLISLTAVAGAVLNTYGRFAIPAFTPVLLNVCLILAALYLVPYFSEPIVALAWGVFIAGVMQLAFQIPFLKRLGFLRLPRIDWHDSGVRRVLTLMVPALFGVSVAQVNLLVDTIFASFLAVGSVSWLYYSDRLMNFPLGVFGVAIATVILPHLSRKHAEASAEHFAVGLDWAVRMVLLIALPSALGLLWLAGPLLATLFGYGEFSVYDVQQARLSLMAFSIGVPAFMLVKVLASAFYAKQNIKTPVKIAVVAMVSNTILLLILIKPLAHMGLALATSIAGFINVGALFYFLVKRGIFVPQPGWLRFAGQLFLANGLLLAWLWFYSPDLSQWLVWGWAGRLLTLALIVVVSMVMYALALFISGMRVRHFRVKH